MLTINGSNKNSILYKLLSENDNSSIKEESELKSSSKSDNIQISSTAKAFNKLDSFLNLGKPDRLDTSDLSKKDKEEFMMMLAKLMKKGIVGYEYLEVDGKKEKHFIVNQLKDDRIKDAELWDERKHSYRNSFKL